MEKQLNSVLREKAQLKMYLQLKEALALLLQISFVLIEVNIVFDALYVSSCNFRAIAVPALLGFSATQAIVIPPISESLKRSRKVPFGLDISISWACCLFTKPRIALSNTKTHTFKYSFIVHYILILLF